MWCVSLAWVCPDFLAHGGLSVFRRKQPGRLPVLARRGPAHSREAASCLAPGERYAANHGKTATFPHKIVPDATGRISRRCGRVPSNNAHTGTCASFDAVLTRRCDMRPVASGTMKISKTSRNPWFAEYRSPWAKHDAASRLCAGIRRAGPGRRFGWFST